MLVAVIMMFLVFSYTGVSVLSVSSHSRTASLETIQNIQLQYEMESNINRALWQINTVADSLVSSVSENIAIDWNAEDEQLIVNIQKYDLESEVTLDLSEDTHFNRALASNNPIDTYGYSAVYEKKHRKRVFKFLPNVDLAYFQDNAVKIHHGNQESWRDEDMNLEGIHIFMGNNINIDSLSLNNSTLVFTGDGITFSGSNSIRSIAPTDSTAGLPVLVFTDPNVNVTLPEGNHFEGVIYCAGQLGLNNPELTGPIIANNIFLQNDLELLDSEQSGFYRWTAGFGEQDDYNWPTQVSRWKNTIWEKKPSS